MLFFPDDPFVSPEVKAPMPAMSFEKMLVATALAALAATAMAGETISYSYDARSLALHEVTHNTRYGRQLSRDFPTRSSRLGSDGHNTRETRTSMAARAITRQLQVEFVCGVFFNGCGQ
jgi:hypothetical protein